MKFHEFVTSKLHTIKQLEAVNRNKAVRHIKKLTPVEFLQQKTQKLINVYGPAVKNSFEHREQNEEYSFATEGIRHALMTIAELDWFADNRPFYNVYPIVEKLVRNTRLDLPAKHLKFPNDVICFRFSKGHEPFGLKTALIKLENFDRESAKAFGPMFDVVNNPTRGISLLAVGSFEVVDDKDRFIIQIPTPLKLANDDGIYDPTVEDMLSLTTTLIASSAAVIEDEMPLYQDRLYFLFRLAILAALIADGDDLITPAILASDQPEYEAATDEDAKRWLEKRAEKIQGRGFDFGRTLQHLSETSPHWRNPHMALFWTGVGRTIPVLKKRAGSVVVPKHLSQVPTGYECPIEEDIQQQKEHVYFLHDPASGYIKIGRTRRTVEERQRESKTFVPGGLKLVGYISTGDCVELETRLHREYGHKRQDNEFFEITIAEAHEIIAAFGGVIKTDE